MEDKEVKDKTVPDKAPEKDLKKPSGKSATGKPLDGIDINPQLNDVSTDGNQLKMRKEDSVDLTVPVIQERKALTLPQRQKRARQLRAREPSMERSRELAKTKLAPPSKIQQRAVAHARAIVKKRFAARKGTSYAELTTPEKIQVDTAVAKKTKLIQKIAARLLPRIRKAEYERLKSFRDGAPLKDLSTQNPAAQGIMPKVPKVTEEMTELFNSLNSQDTTSLIAIIENTIDQFKSNNDPMGEQLRKMLIAVLPEDIITETLLKKSDKTGIAFSTLKEVFERGEYDWTPVARMTQEQYAFTRVNSYIAKGKAWHIDSDLREEKNIDTDLDESFSAFLEARIEEALDKTHPIVKEYNALKKHDIKTLRGMISQSGGVVDTSGFKSKERAISHIIRQKHGNKKVDVAFGFKEETQATKIRKKIELVDRIPADQATKAKQAEIQKKIIDEARAPGKAYVKPYLHPQTKEQIGYVASTKWGKVKYFGKDFKASAMKHANMSEDTAADREIGTKSLVKKYKKDTPGQSSSLDESFTMAWTSGIGVTLSAADCGITMKSGFELHPDVIAQMDEIEEDVTAADKRPVYMPPRRHKDGSYGKASTMMRKTGKKIIDIPEYPDADSDEHDGK